MPSDPLSAIFAALSDPTRRAILARLAEGEAPVGSLAEPFALSLPTISRHLKVLEEARLIARKRDAQWRRCSLDPAPLREASEWIQRYRAFWEQRLDSLARYLAESTAPKRTKPRAPQTEDMMAPFDHTVDIGQELRMSRELPASRERVFAAWTQANALRHWLCPQGFTIPSLTADIRVGGRYRIEMRAPDGSLHRVGGVFRELRPPERLVFTWAWEPENDLAGVETEVTVELREHGKNTLLNLIHRGLPTEAARRSHAGGWNGAMANLDAMLTAGNAR